MHACVQGKTVLLCRKAPLGHRQRSAGSLACLRRAVGQDIFGPQGLAEDGQPAAGHGTAPHSDDAAQRFLASSPLDFSPLGTFGVNSVSAQVMSSGLEAWVVLVRVQIPPRLLFILIRTPTHGLAGTAVMLQLASTMLVVLSVSSKELTSI